MVLPSYLQNKLKSLGINSLNDLKKYDYIKVFQWLKHITPSISFKVLFDLYALNNGLLPKSIMREKQREILQQYKDTLSSYPPLKPTLIEQYLHVAALQAQIAYNNNEIPIGAVVVKDGVIIAKGYNQTIEKQDITQHAEIIALQGAMKELGNYRLDNCDLYVTVEPCCMCAGAILQSRVRRLIFGAFEPKTGAVHSQYKIFTNKLTNHHTEAIGPINHHEYSQLLKQFFLVKRKL